MNNFEVGQRRKQTTANRLITVICHIVAFGVFVVFAMESFGYEVPQLAQNLATAYLVLYGTMVLLLLPIFVIVAIIIGVSVAKQKEVMAPARHKELSNMATQYLYRSSSLKTWFARSVRVIYNIAIIGSGRIWIGSFFMLASVVIWLFTDSIEKMLVDYMNSLTPEKMSELNRTAKIESWVDDLSRR